MTSSRTGAAAVAAYGEIYVIGGYKVPGANGAMAWSESYIIDV